MFARMFECRTRPIVGVLCLLYLVPIFASTAHGQDEAAADAKIIERYKLMLERKPREGSTFDHLYQFYLEGAGLEQMVADYQTATATQPDNPNLQLILGHIHKRLGADAQTLSAYQRAVELAPDDYYPHVALGRAYGMLRRHEDAIAALTRAVELSTASQTATLDDQITLYKALGRAYFNQNRADDAIAAWTKIAELDPQNIFARIELADLFREQELYDQAIAQYRAITEIKRDDPYRVCLCHREIGKIQEAKGNYQEALASYDTALAVTAPDNWLRKDLQDRIIAIYAADENWEGLIKHYQEKLSETPNNPELIGLLASAYIENQQLDEGIASYQKGLALAPTDADLRLNLIKALRNTKRFNEAVTEYETLSERQPDNFDIYRELGELYLQLDDEPRARRTYQRMIDRNPQNAATHLNLAEIYAEHEWFDDAIAKYEKAISLAPANLDYIEYFGECYLRQGDREKTVETWKRMVEGDLGTAANYDRLAQLLEAREFHTEAIAASRKAVALEGDEYRYRETLARQLMMNKEYDEALTQYTETAKLAPNAFFAEHIADQQLEIYRQQGTLVEKLEALAVAPETFDQQKQLAKMYLKLGNVSYATKALAKAKTLQPNDVRVNRSLAELYTRQGQRDEANAIYTHLVEIDRANAREYYAKIARYLMNMMNSDAATYAAKQVVAHSPRHPEGYQLLAEIAEQAGDYETATDNLKQAIRLRPEATDIRAELAEIYKLLGNFRQAIVQYWQCWELSDGVDDKLGFVKPLFEAYYDLGRSDQFEEKLKHKAKAKLSDGSPILALARVYRLKGDLPNARMQLVQALDRERDNPDLLDKLVKISLDLGEPQAALNHQQQLIEVQPHPIHQQRLGELLFKVGREQEAIQVWEKLLYAKNQPFEADVKLATLLIRHGRPEEGLSVLDRAGEKAKDPKAIYQIGSILVEINEFDRARPYFERILHKPKPPKTSTTKVKATVYLPTNYGHYRYHGPPGVDTHIFERAQNIARAIRDAPYGHRSRRPGGQLWRPNNFEEARMGALVQLTDIAQRHGELSELIGQFEADADANPKDLQHLERLAQIHILTRNTDKLKEISRRLIAASPNDPAYQNLLLSREMPKDPDYQTFKKYLDQMTALAPETRLWYIAQYANTSYYQGRKTDAIKILDELDTINVTDQDTSARLVRLLIRVGKLDAAEKKLAQFLKRAPQLWYTSIYQDLATAYVHAGDTGKAVELVWTFLDRTKPSTTNPRHVAKPGYTRYAARYMPLELNYPSPSIYYERERLQYLHQVFIQFWMQNQQEALRAKLQTELESAQGRNRIYPGLALSYCYWWDGKQDQAWEILSALQKGFPNDRTLKHNTFLAAVRTGRHETVLQLLDEFTRIDPQNRYRYYELMLRVVTYTGDIVKVRELVTEVLNSPGGFHELYRFSYQLQQNGFTQYAVAVIEKIMPSVMGLLDQNSLMHHLETLGRGHDAGRIVQRVIRLPNQWNPHNQMLYPWGAPLAVHLIKGSKAVQERKLIEIAQKYPKSFQAHKQLVAFYRNTNQIKKVLPVFETLLALRPKDRTIWLQYAQMLAHTGQAETAMTQYIRLFKENPNTLRHPNDDGLIGTAFQADKVDELVSLTKEMIEQSAGADFSVYFAANVAQRCIENKKHKLAVEIYESIHEVNPNLHDIYEQFADAYVAIGEREKAIQILREKLETQVTNNLQPPSAVMVKLASKLIEHYKDTGEIEALVEEYEAKRAKNPNDPWLLYLVASVKIAADDLEGADPLVDALLDDEVVSINQWWLDSLAAAYREANAPNRELRLLQTATDKLNREYAWGLAEAYEKLGTAYARNGEKEKAAYAFRKMEAIRILKRASSDNWEKQNVAKIYMKHEMWDDAARLFTEIINDLSVKQDRHGQVQRWLIEIQQKREKLAATTQLTSRTQQMLPGMQRLLAKQYMEEYEFDKAAELFKQIVERIPEDLEARAQLAQIYSREKKHDKVLDIWKALLEIDPENTRYQDELVNAYRYADKIPEAIELAQKYVETDAGSRIHHIRLAKVYVASQRVDDAIATYQKLIELNPSDKNVYLESARLHFQKSDTEAARKMVQTAIQYTTHDSERRDIYNEFAKLYFRKGDAETAQRMFQTAIQYATDDSVRQGIIRQMISLYREHGKLEEVLQQVEAEGMLTFEMQKKLAREYGNQGELHKAAKAYQKALDMTTQKSEKYGIYENLIEVYAQLGQTEAAIQCFETLSQNKNSKPRGGFSVPVSSYDSLFVTGPPGPHFRFGGADNPQTLIRAYQHQHRLGDLLAYLEQRRETDSQNLVTLEMIAEIHRIRKDYTKAAESYQQLSKAQPDNVRHLYSAAAALNKSGQPELAQKLVNEGETARSASEQWNRDVRRLMALGGVCLEGELYDTAIELIEVAKANRSFDNNLRDIQNQMLAYAHHGAKRYVEAIEAYQHVEKTAEDAYTKRRAQAKLRQACRDGKLYKRLIAEQILAVEANPDDPNTHSALAQTYKLNDMPHEAIGAYERAKALKPDDRMILARLAELYADAEPHKAKLLYKQLIKLADDPNIRIGKWRTLIEFYKRQGEFDTAIAELLEAIPSIEDKRERSRAIQLLAEIYTAQEQPQKGVVTLERLASQITDNSTLYEMLGDAYKGTGNLQKASTAYTQWIEMRQKEISATQTNWVYPFFVDRLLKKQLPPGKTLELAKRATQDAPTPYRATIMGSTYFRTGHYDAAVMAFKDTFTSREFADTPFEVQRILWSSLIAIDEAVKTGQDVKHFAQLIEALIEHIPPDAAGQVYANAMLSIFYRKHNKPEAAERWMRKSGVIPESAWWIIGPFDDVWNTAFRKGRIPEEAVEIDPTASYKGKTEPVSWKQVVDKTRDGYVDFAQIFGFEPRERSHHPGYLWHSYWTMDAEPLTPINTMVAYAWVSVNSPDERQAQIWLSTLNTAQIWIDGKAVFTINTKTKPDSFKPEYQTVPVTLNAGKNSILVKLGGRKEGWGFYLWLTDMNGEPLADLTLMGGATAQ